jgi:uncharacterized membrane protein YqjE
MRTDGGGLFQSLRRLLDTVVDIAQTRLALIGTELEQEKLRLLGALWQGALALLLLGLALVCALGFVVLLFWDGYRLPAIGVLTLLLGGGGAWLLRSARQALRSPEGGVFALSLGELRRDRDGLAPDVGPGASADLGAVEPGAPVQTPPVPVVPPRR